MEEDNQNELQTAFSLHDGQELLEVTQSQETAENENEQVQQEQDHKSSMSVEINRIQELHRTFSSVINDFSGDKSVERIVQEYEKMYEALKESHSKQREYMSECANLRLEIKNNAERVHLALHLSHEDKEIISNLAKQVNQAWNEVDLLAEKETKARSVISKLQEEFASLTTIVEAGTGIQELQELAYQAVMERKDLETGLLTLKEEIEFKDLKLVESMNKAAMKEEVNNKEMSKLKDKLAGTDKRRMETQQKLDDTEEQCKILERLRANLNAENRNNMIELDNLRTRLAKLEKEEADGRAEVARLTQLCSEQQENILASNRENAKLKTQTQTLKRKLDHFQSLNENQKEKLHEKDRDVTTCERMMKKKITEIDSLVKKSEQTSRTLRMVSKQLSDKEEEIKLEKEQVDKLKTCLGQAMSKITTFQKEVRTLEQKTNEKYQAVLNLTNQKLDLEQALGIKNKANMGMTREINEMSKQMTKAVETVNALESDKRQLYRRINQILELVNDLANDNDSKVTKLMVLLRVNSQQESLVHSTNARLVHMTNQRDNINNELHLVMLKNEELTSANLNYSKQSDTLAENLHTKEVELSAMITQNDHLKSEISSLHNEVTDLKEVVRGKDTRIEEVEKDVHFMDKLLCKKERKIGEMNDVVEQIVTQRNLLGYQCSKKMEHINFLIEKNKVMHTIFKSGNRSYQAQEIKMEQLKLKILDLYREKGILAKRIQNIENLKSKLGLANQQLVGSLAKCRAMEGEHPYNLHRWRHLKALDISQYEMVLKIQHLQRRVISKTEEVTHVESLLIDKTTVVEELRRMLENRPGPEIVQRANADRHEKEQLSRKLKATMAERNMCMWKIDRQVYHNRNVITRCLEEQKKSLALKKNNAKLKEKLAKLPSIKPGPQVLSLPQSTAQPHL